MSRQDQAWKNALQALFPHALEFFLPSLEAHRDRTRPFEFLEQELRAVSRGVRRGGVVDALVKHGMISPQDVDLFQYADTPQEALDLLQAGLHRYYLDPQEPLPQAEQKTPAIAESRTKTPRKPEVD